MAEKIPQHVHCNMCWKAIPVDEKFCSDECKQKFMTMRRRGRILWYFLLVLAAALFVMIFVGSN
jgi:predicted nucleic acid-binding Zn ribbon protein